MTEEKFVKSNKKYLDLAKEITYKLHEICVNSDEEYNLVTVLAGVAIGTYMFIKELAKATDQSTKDLLQEVRQWVDWADSKFNKS